MAYRMPAPLDLSAEERSELESWARRRKTAQGLALRAKIVLLAADGLSDTTVAAELSTGKHTVGKWRERLGQRAYGRAPRRAALGGAAPAASHWSRRSMAKAGSVSGTTVGRVWGAFGLQPHRSETFKLSTDPMFAEKVRDIVGLYLAPPARALVLCVDEKSQVQASMAAMWSGSTAWRSPKT